MGIGESTTYPAGNRVIREWIPASERGLAMSIFNSGAYFGPAVGAIVIGALVTAFGWRPAFYVCGLIGFVCVEGGPIQATPIPKIVTAQVVPGR